MQTQQQIHEIISKWWDNERPRRLQDTDHNVSAILRYLNTYAKGFVSSTNLTAAVQALGERLDYDPAERIVERIVEVAPQKTAQELANEDRLRKANLGILPDRSREDSMRSVSRVETAIIRERERAERDRPTFATTQAIPEKYTPQVLKKMSGPEMRALMAKFGHEAINARLRGDNA